MFFPVGTDAPVYHRPYGTVGLIFLQIYAFIKSQSLVPSIRGRLFHTSSEVVSSDWWAMTSLYYPNPLYFIGCMLFFWGFGMIIEGRIGFLRFLAVYAALSGVVELASHLLFGGIKAGGSSAILFGMMMIVLIWAPANRIELIWIYRRAWGMQIDSITVDCTLITFCFWCVFLNLICLLLTLVTFQLSWVLFCVIGSSLGLLIAIQMMRFNLVDCEQLDLFNVWHTELKPGVGSFWGWKGKSPEDLAMRDQPVNLVLVEDRIQAISDQVKSRKFQAAYRNYELLDNADRAKVSVESLHKLINGLVQQKFWNEAAHLLADDYLKRRISGEKRARLTLAGIYVREQHRPRAALRVLEPLRGEELTSEERSLVHRIQNAAKQQIADGVMELSD